MQTNLRVIGAGLVGLMVGWLCRGFRESTSTGSSSFSAAVGISKNSTTGSANPVAGPTSNTGTAAQTTGERLKSIFQIASAPDRLQAFANCAQGLSLAELPLAAEMIFEADKDGLQSGPEWSWLLREWGRKGGKEGIDQLLQLYGKDHDGDYMAQMALRGWAENDLQGAAAWLNTHTENKDWQGCLYSILLGASNKDLNVATTAAIQSTTPDLTWLRNKSAEMLAETAVRQGGLANLKSWFASLPDNADSSWFRKAAMEHVATSLDHASMKQSMEFLESVAAEPWRNDKPYRAVMHKLAEKNPQRALEWAQGLPPSPETKQWPGMETAVRTWLNQDPAGLTRWIDSQASSAFATQVKQMQSKLSK